MASNLSGQAEIEWTARRILLAILTVLGVVIAFALLYRFYMVVFLFFIAFSLKVAFDPFVNWLKRQGVRREVSLILLYTVLATLLLFLIWMIAPALIEQTQIVVEQLPSLYSSIRNALIAQPIGLVRGVGLVLPSEISLPELAALTPDSEQESAPWVTLSSMMWAFFAFVSVFVMAYFWTLEGDLILRRLLLRAPATRREELRILIAEIQGKISGYFRGQLILCSSIGVASTIAFFLIGLPNPLLLGLLMAIFEAVPIVGPVLGAIPALLMAASSAPEKTLWVVGAVVAIQVAESNLLVPRVMDKAVGVNAIISLLAIAAFGALFGFAGALLAVPLAAILQILFSRLLFDATGNYQPSRPGGASNHSQRHRLAVTQLQTQHLAQDARRLARTDEAQDYKSEQMLDELEEIAHRLDRFLADREVRA